MLGVRCGSRCICKGNAEQDTAEQITNEQQVYLEGGGETCKESHHSFSARIVNRRSSIRLRNRRQAQIR